MSRSKLPAHPQPTSSIPAVSPMFMMTQICAVIQRLSILSHRSLTRTIIKSTEMLGKHFLRLDKMGGTMRPHMISFEQFI